MYRVLGTLHALIKGTCAQGIRLELKAVQARLLARVRVAAGLAQVPSIVQQHISEHPEVTAWFSPDSGVLHAYPMPQPAAETAAAAAPLQSAADQLMWKQQLRMTSSSPGSTVAPNPISFAPLRSLHAFLPEQDDVWGGHLDSADCDASWARHGFSSWASSERHRESVTGALNWWEADTEPDAQLGDWSEPRTEWCAQLADGLPLCRPDAFAVRAGLQQTARRAPRAGGSPHLANMQQQPLCSLHLETPTLPIPAQPPTFDLPAVDAFAEPASPPVLPRAGGFSSSIWQPASAPCQAQPTCLLESACIRDSAFGSAIFDAFEPTPSADTTTRNSIQPPMPAWRRSLMAVASTVPSADVHVNTGVRATQPPPSSLTAGGVLSAPASIQPSMLTWYNPFLGTHSTLLPAEVFAGTGGQTTQPSTRSPTSDSAAPVPTSSQPPMPACSSTFFSTTSMHGYAETTPTAIHYTSMAYTEWKQQKMKEPAEKGAADTGGCDRHPPVLAQASAKRHTLSLDACLFVSTTAASQPASPLDSGNSSMADGSAQRRANLMNLFGARARAPYTLSTCPPPVPPSLPPGFENYAHVVSAPPVNLSLEDWPAL